MRFLMLNWRDPRNPLSGGAERVTLGYLSALAQRGHEVFWFANAFPGCTRAEVIHGVQIVRGGRMGSSIFAARSWYKTQPRFDLVMDQHHGIPWFTPWWCGTSHVSYIHEVLGPIWNAFYPWPLSWIGRTQERWTHWLYRNARFWTACESTRDDLKRHGVRHVSIVRYGVDTVALPELPAKNLTQPVRLAVVSRLAPNKRIGEAVKLANVLRTRGIAAQLDIVGGGEEEPSLRSLVQQLQLQDCVHFRGRLPEETKDALLRDAHFLIHTSQREGWGLNVIEANAMGTPAVVYPVAGLRESTLHQRTGWVSAAETPKSLADGIARLLAKPDLYQTYRINAWQRAKLFHWSRILPAACDWLEALARGEHHVEPAELL
ncbi:MAG TPA: glycosyltransferase family 4 protein [Methylomirabilota bacterium]|nr:glycosyltransferase family 4 protein [Methylomirabilota bacterium]